MADEEPDGRRARRERNVALALQATCDMFRDDTLVPSIEAVSRRTGLSIRSLYRYFPDVDALISAAIEQSLIDGRRRAHISGFGRGPFAERLDAFVGNRVRLYEAQAPQYRATVHHAHTVPQLRDALDRSRRWLRDQVLGQFAVELDALDKRERHLAAMTCDTISQFDSLDYLRTVRRCPVRETEAVVARTIRTALGPPPPDR